MIENISVLKNGALLDSLSSRPLRLLPDGRTCGITRKGRVYGLGVARPDGSGYFIDIATEAFDPDLCATLPASAVVATEGIGAASRVVYLGRKKAGTQAQPRLRIDWYVESNAYGHYLVFNGSRSVLDTLVRALEANGLSWRRADKSYRPADNGKSYDWFIRLDDDRARADIEPWLARAVALAEEILNRAEVTEAAHAAPTPPTPASPALASAPTDLKLALARAEKRASDAEALAASREASLRQAEARLEGIEQARAELESRLRAIELGELGRAIKQQRENAELRRQLEQKSQSEQASLRRAEEAEAAVERARKALLARSAELDRRAGAARAIDEAVADLRRSLANEQKARKEAELRLGEAEGLRVRAESQLELMNELIDSETQTHRDVVSTLKTELELERRRAEAGEQELVRLRAELQETTSNDDEVSDRVDRVNSRQRLLERYTDAAIAAISSRLRVARESTSLIAERVTDPMPLFDRLRRLANRENFPSTPIGDRGWKELREHIQCGEHDTNRRLRVYWRPNGESLLMHVFFKKDDAAQRRLHEQLQANATYGF